MKLSVAVAAHPNRTHLVKRLVKSLDIDSVDWAVSWDRKDDIWDTHQRAWEIYPVDATHHLVLQDDALPCRDLLNGLKVILPSVGDNLVSLYFGNALSHPKIVKATKMADETGSSWIVSTGFWWGVAALIPTSNIADMLTFCEGRRETYDRRLSIWAEHRQYPVYYPWPSLVDHVDEKSLAHVGRKPGRKAYQFVGEEFSAIDFPPLSNPVPCGKIMPHVATTLTNRK